MSIAENQVISNQLQNAVVGKTIVKTVANQNPHSFVWFAAEPQFVFAAPDISHKEAKKYDKLLTGRKIKNSDVHFGSYSTYNFLYIGDRALMFSLPTRYYVAGEKQPKRHQLHLTFDDGSSLELCGSLGGMIYLFRVNKEGLAVDYLPPSFPSVLSKEFSQAFFLKFIRNTDLSKLQPAKTVKCFLATKNRIPGLDNAILHEILWEARVNPKSVMAALGQNDYKRLYTAIKKVFPAVIKAGGRDTEKDIFGNFGGYVTKASRNTLGKPCGRCGEPIMKESYLGGVVYYCPSCQPIVKV
jgi:formamidopyrimidine-DNA glycosylase